MGEKKARSRKGLELVNNDEWATAAINWSNFRANWKTPRDSIFAVLFEGRYRDYAVTYGDHTWFKAALARRIRMCSSPHHETLLKAYFAKRWFKSNENIEWK